MLILGGLSALGPLSTDMYLPALPALSRELGATMAQTQLTLSAGILGLSLGQVIAGPSSDALGRRRPLLIGVAAFALASLLCIIAPSIAVLILLRFVQGSRRRRYRHRAGDRQRSVCRQRANAGVRAADAGERPGADHSRR